MVEESSVEQEYQPDESGLIKLEDLLPLLTKEAEIKNLKIFIFKNEEIKEFFETKTDQVGVVLLAKNKDNALNNLKNLRKCYAVKI